MNTKLILASALGLMLSLQTFAQNDSVDMYQVPPPPKVKKEKKIIIKRDGNKEEKTVVEMNGDNIIINGKPMKLDQLNDMQVLGDHDGFKIVPDIFSNFSQNKALLGVITTNDERGAKITEVTAGSPAEKAGLKVGDIIIKINDIAIKSPDGLHDAIGKFKPEENVNVTYLTGTNTESTVTVKLDKNKESEAIVWSGKNFNQNFNFPKNFPGGNVQNFKMQFDSKPRLGLQIQDLEEGNGVKITDVDDESPAAKAGLKDDDIVIEINGTDVKNVDDVRAKIKGLKEGDVYKIKYKRDGSTQTTEVKIPKKLKTADL